MKLKAIISGGAEAYRVADQLKAKNIPVIVGPVLRVPVREDDPYDAAFTNAGLLSKGWCEDRLQTNDSAYSRICLYTPEWPRRLGCRKKKHSRRSRFIRPIFGIADRIGSIELGKIANLIVTDGDPLEIRTQS